MKKVIKLGICMKFFSAGMQNKFKKSIAFTLAEVLIVIGIIGIVAALTIPTIIAENQKKTYVTQLRKFYSNFQNGIRLYMNNQGCSDLTCTGIFNSVYNNAAWQNNVKAAILSTFNVSSSYVYSDFSSLSYNYIGASAGTDTPFDTSSSFMLADGSLIGINDNDGGNCTIYSTVNDDKKLKNACTYVYIDINGFKEPNIYGRDLYVFLLSNQGFLYPHRGIDYAKAYANSENYTTSSGYWNRSTAASSAACGLDGSSMPTDASGNGCSARIIESGWEMNY